MTGFERSKLYQIIFKKTLKKWKENHYYNIYYNPKIVRYKFNKPASILKHFRMGKIKTDVRPMRFFTFFYFFTVEHIGTFFYVNHVYIYGYKLNQTRPWSLIIFSKTISMCVVAKIGSFLSGSFNNENILIDNPIFETQTGSSPIFLAKIHFQMYN